MKFQHPYSAIYINRVYSITVSNCKTQTMPVFPAKSWSDETYKRPIRNDNICLSKCSSRGVETDADTSVDATVAVPYRSYERRKKLQLHYNKLCHRGTRCENRTKRGEQLRGFIRHREYKFAQHCVEGHQKFAIYLDVKAKSRLLARLRARNGGNFCVKRAKDFSHYGSKTSNSI